MACSESFHIHLQLALSQPWNTLKPIADTWTVALYFAVFF